MTGGDNVKKAKKGRKATDAADKKATKAGADEKTGSGSGEVKPKVKKAKEVKADKDGKVKKSKKTKKEIKKVEGARADAIKKELEDEEDVVVDHGALTAAAHPMVSPGTELYIGDQLKCANAINPKFCIRGVKEVTKFARRFNGKKKPKKTQALALFAGDVSPVDILTHLPVMVEDQYIPFIWVRSQDMLGRTCGTRRKTAVVVVQRNLPEPTQIKEAKKTGQPIHNEEEIRAKHKEQVDSYKPIFKKLQSVCEKIGKADERSK